MPSDQELRVKEIIQRTHNVLSARLEASSEIAYKAGQFLQVILNNNPSLKRYLSLSSSPAEKGYIEFTKKITQSDFSMALQALKPGDIVKVRYPLGKFTLEDNSVGNKIAFISGGIGITPIRSIVKFAVDSNAGIDTVLLYANRSAADIVFREELEAMQKLSPKFKLIHVLCEPAPGVKCVSGRVDGAVVRKEIPDFTERKFFLCGPPGMVEAMKKMLVDELSLPAGQVITEDFVGY